MAPNSNSRVLPSGINVTRTSFPGEISFFVDSLIYLIPGKTTAMINAGLWHSENMKMVTGDLRGAGLGSSVTYLYLARHMPYLCP
jgi:hypothetical protein